MAERNNNGLYFIVGGIVVVVALLFFFMSGRDTGTGTVDTTAPAGTTAPEADPATPGNDTVIIDASPETAPADTTPGAGVEPAPAGDPAATPAPAN